MKRGPYFEHPDPEYLRWGKAYPKFPGVAECVRLIRANKCHGAWLDIVVEELARHARAHLSELTDAFQDATSGDIPSEQVALVVMMALEIAQLPESIEFLSKVLQQCDQRFATYARRTLESINTRESRTALFHAKQGS